MDLNTSRLVRLAEDKAIIPPVTRLATSSKVTGVASEVTPNRRMKRGSF